eukprot:scaffold47_cov258-Pinguiococcus_pyrenoidosus.AAC.51
MLRRLISPTLRVIRVRPVPRFLSSAGAPKNTETESAPTSAVPPADPSADLAHAAVEPGAADALVELPVEELGYYPSHLVVQAVEFLHASAGLPYWAAIVGIAVGYRAFLSSSTARRDVTRGFLS